MTDKPVLVRTRDSMTVHSGAQTASGGKVMTAVVELKYPQGHRSINLVACNCPQYTYGYPCSHVKDAAIRQIKMDDQFDDDKRLNPLEFMLASGVEYMGLQTDVEGIVVPVLVEWEVGNLYNFFIAYETEGDPFMALSVPLLEPLSTMDNMANLQSSVGDALYEWSMDRMQHPFTECKSPLHNKTGRKAPHEDLSFWLSATGYTGWGTYAHRLIADWYLLLAQGICVNCYEELPQQISI